MHEAGNAYGQGWNGTKYEFTASLSGGRDSESISGTAYLDQQGRVRYLETITKRPGFTVQRDFTFGAFGPPVPVTAPPGSQVEYTSTPPWGLYF